MSYILEHGEHFLKTTQRTLCDMFGFEDAHAQDVTEEKQLASGKSFQVSLLFTGTIQGEYVLAMNKKTAALILGMADSDTPEEAVDEMRNDFSDAFSEALNVIVGEVISKLSRDFKRLTFASPKITFGATIYPLIPTAKGVLASELGEIECYFHLNLMKLNLTTCYNEALENYRQAQILAEQATADIIAQQAQAKEVVDATVVDNMSIQEKLQLVFHPGFSTCGDDNLHVNRGVGLAMVKSEIEALSGAVELKTTFRKETVFKLSFPVSA